MSLINTGQPATLEAIQRYNEITADGWYSDTTKNVCRVALAAVGRQKWHNGMLQLGNATSVIDFNKEMNCFTAVIYWALLGGGLSKQQVKSYFQIIQSARGETTDANNKVKEILYDSKKLKTYIGGSVHPPAGSMVFHGTPDSPIYHVTMSVGKSHVVSCYHAQYMKSDDMKKQFTDLLSLGWVPDTLYLPIEAFGKDNMLKFTELPFWEQW